MRRQPLRKKRLWIRFWRDERAAISSVSLILIYTILVIGSITGLVCMRNQIVQELGDLAVAFDSLDQSFEVDWNADGVIDASYSDPGPTLVDNATEAPAGIMLNEPARAEGGAVVTNTPGEGL